MSEPGGPARWHQDTHGRGAQINPAGRFERLSLAVLPDHAGADDLILIDDGPPGEGGERRIPTRVYRDRSRTFINPVDSPDLHFSWSINPYRGCEHGCIYCYARPTHETFGLSSGLDFETRLFAKTDGAELLRRELAAPKWRGEPIMMSGITDAYQPIERRLGITRACMEIMAACRQPVTIVTKSALILRDLDLLKQLADVGATGVAVSLTTLDPSLAAMMEPRASSPRERLRAIRELSSAGVPVMAMTAPIIPGLNDREIPALLEAAAEAGARGASFTLVRLPFQVKDLFLDWLRRRFPDRASHIETLIRACRDGALNDSRFGRRMRGEGEIAGQIKRVFTVFKKRYGLDRPMAAVSSAAFRRPDPPADPAQPLLFP